MSTITKQWLQQKIAEMEATRDEIPFGLGEDGTNTLAALRIALASLELERGMIRRFDLDMSDCDSCGQDCGADMVEDLDGEYVLWDEVLPHLYRYDEYTAPPAPVSVPDEREAFNACNNDTDCPLAGRDAKTAAWLAWSRRAAMLQGAEPVTTAYKLPFDQWLSQQIGTIEVECGCVMTEVFFHWLRVAYEAGNSPAVLDGWVACSERMPEQFKAILAFNEHGEVWSGAYDRYWNFYCDNLLVEHVTHWMPLPAAPQQEVKL